MEEILDILLRVHHLEAEIKESEKRLSDIPLRIAKLEAEIEKTSADLIHKKERLQEIKTSYKMHEGDIQENEEKAKKLNTQTLTVKTNEEYRAMQKEIDYLRDHNKTIEEEMMALLEEEEQLKGSLAKLSTEVQAATAVKRGEIETLTKEKNELEEETALTRAQYEDEKLKLPPDVLIIYERVSKARGNAISLVKDNSCTGCYAHITHQILNELQKKHKLHLCEGCGRILLFVPGSR